MDTNAATATAGLDFRGNPGVAMHVLAAELLSGARPALEVLRRALPALKTSRDDRAELVIPGKQAGEVVLLAYLFRPSTHSGAFTGPVVITALAKWLESLSHRRYTYRLIFVPEALGAMEHLSGNIERLVAVFDLTGTGEARAYSGLPTRVGGTLSDRAALHAHRHQAGNLSAGVRSDLYAALEALRKAVAAVEANATFRATTPCEPNLGKRGLYPTVSTKDTKRQVRSMMNVLAYADGVHDLLTVADMLEVPVWDLALIAQTLEQHGLLQRVEDRNGGPVHAG
jgi:aminopeptidase-like protein